MRIEQINENQIRCFLTREEMDSRHLKLKELAYGTENARRLFHELMQAAYRKFGFESGNMPVMIEAVPLHDQSLVLNITRVENPEELDTRFSSFAPFVRSGSEDDGVPDSSALSQLLEEIRRQLDRDGATEAENRPASSAKSAAGHSAAKKAAPEASGDGHRPERAGGRKNILSMPHPQLYTFQVLGKAAEAAGMAAPFFRGASSLYRDPSDARYYLFLSPEKECSAADFHSALSVFSEFGTSEYITPAREQHLREHCEVLCADDAVQRLAALED